MVGTEHSFRKPTPAQSNELGRSEETSESCTVYVGRKFFIRYLLAILFKLNILSCREVRVEALGRNIYRAVMVVESAKYITGRLKVKSILIGSVVLVGRSTQNVRRSKITIILERL